MSFVSLRGLWKHSGDVSEMMCDLLDPFKITMDPYLVPFGLLRSVLRRYCPSVNILVPHGLNVYHYIKKFWKQITNIYTKGSCKLLVNGLSADSTIIAFCSAPHGFTRYSSRNEDF
ncbi:hypothetical protein E3N88_04392 [Mikania micrantha]|uniref:Uncharacterized protein n=1 Tax=Mikania micrantha TaxID=192012 RepID=A0A5N6PUD8_9ASTR|nr:hypothetical protein E3N88_04392 [Mikania micrantha]